MKTLRDFSRVFDRHTFLIMILALLSTYLCRLIGFVADMPITVVGIAVVFPLVFSINSAYRRREDALNAFANIKGHLMALYFAHRDWAPKAYDHSSRSLQLFQDLIEALTQYFQTSNPEQKRAVSQVFKVFSAFSESHEVLRKAGVTTSEISRANQYLRGIMIDFEKMNNVLNYRTPVALRAYSRLFLNLFPVLFGPYFANVAYPDSPLIGYIIAILYAVVLVSLDNIQDHLENPYDGIGPDDLKLNIGEDYKNQILVS